MLQLQQQKLQKMDQIGEYFNKLISTFVGIIRQLNIQQVNDIFKMDLNRYDEEEYQPDDDEDS